MAHENEPTGTRDETRLRKEAEDTVEALRADLEEERKYRDRAETKLAGVRREAKLWEEHAESAEDSDKSMRRVHALIIAPDLLHPTGRCSCGGEGRCNWCKVSPDSHQASIEAQVESLKALAPGWYEADTPAYEPAALDWFATTLVRVLDGLDLPRPYIYPTPEGSVRVEWSGAQWEVSATFDLETHQADVLAARVGSNEFRELTVPLTDVDAEKRLGGFLQDHLVRGARFLKRVQEAGDLDVSVLISSRFPSTEWARETSEKVLEIFRRAECPLEPRVVTSREGCVVLVFEKDRRIANYECDLDGEVVLTLVDYNSDRDPQAEVLELSAVRASINRALVFLG